MCGGGRVLGGGGGRLRPGLCGSARGRATGSGDALRGRGRLCRGRSTGPRRRLDPIRLGRAAWSMRQRRSEEVGPGGGLGCFGSANIGPRFLTPSVCRTCTRRASRSTSDQRRAALHRSAFLWPAWWSRAIDGGGLRSRPAAWRSPRLKMVRSPARHAGRLGGVGDVSGHFAPADRVVQRAVHDNVEVVDALWRDALGDLLGV
jgi:hypothetical protein